MMQAANQATTMMKLNASGQQQIEKQNLFLDWMTNRQMARANISCHCVANAELKVIQSVPY